MNPRPSPSSPSPPFRGEREGRRETPLPLIEMFDALFSLAPGLSAKQKRKGSDEIIATALKRLERKDA
jgi:hypothetical protein